MWKYPLIIITRESGQIVVTLKNDYNICIHSNE
jgi:hypothetical protein